jgi:Domain of Unknown Function (DUF1080)
MLLSRRYLAVLPALALGVFVHAQDPQDPKPGFADPVLGRWDLTVQGADAPYPSWLEIQLRKETQLMGRFVGRSGSVRHLTQIAYRDGDLTFGLPVQYEQNKTDLAFTAKLAGDRMEGTTEDAKGKPLTWSAVRAPALRRETAPKWGAPVTLFNGRDLEGWKLRSPQRGNCWSVVDGALTATPPCVDLISAATFGDFKLHVEFSYPAKSNSGLYLRGRYEVQIQDDAGRATDPLRMGGVYGFLRPYVDAAGPPGSWQTYDVTLVGRRVTVVLNGKTTTDDEIIPGITGGALDSDEGARGPLMLQGDHGKIAFRSVVLTPAP